METARCYCCLVPHPARALRSVQAPCGCEHQYCEACLQGERIVAFLLSVGARCMKSAAA
jgi:hypothetical protein